MIQGVISSSTFPSSLALPCRAMNEEDNLVIVAAAASLPSSSSSSSSSSLVTMSKMSPMSYQEEEEEVVEFQFSLPVPSSSDCVCSSLHSSSFPPIPSPSSAPGDDHTVNTPLLPQTLSPLFPEHPKPPPRVFQQGGSFLSSSSVGNFYLSSSLLVENSCQASMNINSSSSSCSSSVVNSDDSNSSGGDSMKGGGGGRRGEIMRSVLLRSMEDQQKKKEGNSIISISSAASAAGAVNSECFSSSTTSFFVHNHKSDSNSNGNNNVGSGGNVVPPPPPSSSSSSTTTTIGSVGGVGGSTTTTTMMMKASSQRSKKKMMNEIWKERLRFIEGYLDVEAMLLLRQTARVFYRHKYKPESSVLNFIGFRGYEPKVIWENILPTACRAVHSSVRESLKFDFSCCALLKDSSVARIMDVIHGEATTNTLLGNLKLLNFDFCYLITDKGLSALLTTHLPFLESLSLRCARSKLLTGMPFKSDLEARTWPRFCSFTCSFTNTWLEPVEVVADFITERARDWNKSPYLEIFGSWASKCLFEKVGFGAISKSFCMAVKEQNHEVLSRTTKRMQKEFLELSQTAEWKNSNLVQLVKTSGSELLVNSPLTIATSEEGGVGVWTLPLSIAIQTEDHDSFNMLLKRGAKVDVWDYLGKSPLFRACEAEREDLVEVLVDQGASLVPHDLSGQSPLDISIKKKYTEVVQLLVKRGAVLNYKCPAVRTYKSALYVACEVNSPEIIQMFLEGGADPNWKSNTKFTPTLLAYQLNSAWLSHFLNAGAGSPVNKRWVLTEVLGCAIMKSDLVSVMLLVKKYPDLLLRSHHMWSKPHIQAAKLGKYEILAYLLANGSDVNARGEDGQTAIHVATEEGHVKFIELLLDEGADINKGNFDGQNALHIACLENRYEAAEMLLRHGHDIGEECDVNCRDKINGETALMTCIRTRNENMARLILRHARSLRCDTTDNQGRSALMCSIFFGQYSIADQLMARGADVAITDDAGNSPYTIVCERMFTPGSDKKVLRKYLRLYKAKGRRPANRQGLLASSSSVPASLLSTTRSNSSPVDDRLSSNKNVVCLEGQGVVEGSSTLGNKTGKKLKIEPKAVFSIARLPMALFRATKAK